MADFDGFNTCPPSQDHLYFKPYDSLFSGKS